MSTYEEFMLLIALCGLVITILKYNNDKDTKK